MPLILMTKMNAPAEILDAIAYVETRTEVINGKIYHVGKHLRGMAGELGVYQITKIAFKDVAKPTESFTKLLHDPAYCREIADRYLFKLYLRHGSWGKAIVKYNGSSQYLTLVEKRLASRQR
jgi:hypothetical protein